MRILITGYKGFIGQNMVKALESHTLSYCEWGEPEYDLSNLDLVIHLGAISDTRCKDWDALQRQNVDFTINLINRCQHYGVPIQIASSASVYGLKNTTFLEDDITNPANLYAKSKSIIEDYYQSITPLSPIQIFRYFNVYGPYEDHKGDQASPFHKFKLQSLEGKIMLFEGSDEFKRDFVHVDTVIDIHKAFFNKNRSGIWNIGSGVARSFLSVAQEIGGPIEFIPMPEDLKPNYQAFTKANLTKLNHTLLT